MKLDSLMVVSGMVWLVLLVAILTGVDAKPLDAEAVGDLRARRSSHTRDWYSLRHSRTVPDFVLGALEQLQHREKRFPRVPMGTQCTADSHCPADHCCAMRLGKAVCQPRLTQGRTCLVNGQQAYSTNVLFTHCPCSTIQGLSCRRVDGHGIRGVCSAS